MGRTLFAGDVLRGEIGLVGELGESSFSGHGFSVTILEECILGDRDVPWLRT